MGNCLHRECDSDSKWGGDDWGSTNSSPAPVILSTHDDDDDQQKVDRRELLNEECSKSKELKIKISKKQLKELLGKVDLNELTVEQVLAQLINSINNTNSHSDNHLHHHDHQGQWKPNLQTIPE